MSDTPTTPAEAEASEAAEETEAPEVDELRDGVVARLRELHPDAVLGSHVDPGTDIWVRVDPEAWVAVAESLRYVLGARYFCFLSAIDWKPSPYGRYHESEVDKVLDPPEPKQLEMTTGVAGGDTRFQVFYRLVNQKDRWAITVKADCAGTEDTPHVESLTKVFAGADWHERETWEMFGITFVGHPFLRHIYLPTDFEGHPLRKDFPLLARMIKPWPGIVDIEQFPATEDETGEAAAGEATAAEGETAGAADAATATDSEAQP